MKITFALWSTERNGGTNAIFQVADRLGRMGHTVTIVSAGTKNHGWFTFTSPVKFLYPEAEIYPSFKIGKKKVLLSEVISYLIKKFSHGLEISRHRLLAEAIPPDSECIIATFFETAFSVQMAEVERAKKFYYVQHFESVFFTDSVSKQRVKQTYFFPLRKIVSSTWANNMLAKEIGQTGSVVLPGIDTSTFRPCGSTSRPSGFTVVALGKAAPVKGLKYLLEGLSMANDQIPGLRLVLFGTEPELKDLSPVKTEYIIGPSNEQLANIYSNSDVLVTPSLFESSPSPPLEAMACGTPVVTTQFGTEDYCFDGFNSLVIPPKNPSAISRALVSLYGDSELREKLRKNGLQTVKELNWDKTASEFNSIITANIE